MRARAGAAPAGRGSGYPTSIHPFINDDHPSSTQQLHRPHLRHVLEEHVGGNLVAGVGPEAVLEVVEVEAEADEPADGLARHAGAGLARLKLPAGREHALQHVTG